MNADKPLDDLPLITVTYKPPVTGIEWDAFFAERTALLAKVAALEAQLADAQSDLDMLSTVVERCLDAIKGRPFRTMRSVYRSIAERRAKQR